jgi:WS/DGAT/MGAT family acyltransferase
MQQLPALDAVFLSIETPENPTNIGGLALLDPSTTEGYYVDRFQDFVAERIALCPRFSFTVQEVPLGADRPYFVEGGELQIEKHVRRVALPFPGGQHELHDLAGFLFQRQLDRDRPLWEMYFIEGLQGGRCAVLWKMHHCLIDGVSGAGLVEILFDAQPEPGDTPLVPINEKGDIGGPASFGEMLRQGLRNGSERPRALGRHLAAFGSDAIDNLRNKDNKPLDAPRVSFNGSVSAQRSLATTRISLDEVKELKRALGVTVNDVVLALTSGAVRRYLELRDELPETPLVAMVPMSTRAKDDKSLGNQIVDAPVTWATHIEDPIERVAVIHDAMRKLKTKEHKTGVIPMIAESLPPFVTKAMISLAAANSDTTPLPANCVVSNVPSSPMPLYMAGARIEGLIPMSILSPTQGLNITVVSYCGEMHFGLTVDPELVPEPGVLTDGIAKSLVELREALSRRG